ncbi:MAG: HdaA/DnaA family protein [Wenzhouxiangella sp.]
MSQHQIPLALKPPRRPGFENFIAGPNKVVVSTLERGLEAGSWYFLGGPAGSGRTHLLAAAFGQCHRAGTIASFVSLALHANRGLLSQAGGDWVFVDDIDTLAGDAESEMLLFNALNRWRSEQTGVVMSGFGREAFELPDLRSRLGQATRLTLKPLEEDDLFQLIRRLAAEHEVVLGRGAIDYLISRSARNPASVARLMEQLAIRALSERRTVSVPLVREVMVDNK